MINFIKNIDLELFKLINIKWHFSPLDNFLIYITNAEYGYVAVGLAILLLLLGKRYHVLSALLILATAELDWFLITFLKSHFNRMRPFLTDIPGVNFLVNTASGASFPSGHAMLAFSLATVLALRYPRLRFLAFLSALLVGYSRIYVGVHYPFDVLTGAVLGFLVSWILVKITKEE